MKKKRIIVMVVQLVIIIAFAVSLITHTNNKIDDVTIFKYANDISANTLITKNDVRSARVPRGAMTAGMEFDSRDDIVGMYTRTNVYKGTTVYDIQLINEDITDPFASIDLSNYRKYSIPVSFEGTFGGSVARGDKIDLIFVGDIDAGHTSVRDAKYSKTFLEDVLIESVSTRDGFKFIDRSRFTEDEARTSSEEEISATTNSSDIGILTLLVTPDQAEEIAVRRIVGDVELVGRLKGDTYNQINREKMSYNDFLSIFGIQNSIDTIITREPIVKTTPQPFSISNRLLDNDTLNLKNNISSSDIRYVKYNHMDANFELVTGNTVYTVPSPQNGQLKSFFLLNDIEVRKPDTKSHAVGFIYGTDDEVDVEIMHSNPENVIRDIIEQGDNQPQEEHSQTNEEHSHNDDAYVEDIEENTGNNYFFTD